ncbi:MAG: hypothetical protein MUF83_02790 [Acidimicrobiales bacterium]|jgi:hypothetical protein|nr:hypothetical protein [Acidimicrobiales bacterium]
MSAPTPPDGAPAEPGGRPHNPRIGRQRYLVRFLQLLLVVTFGLAVASLVAPTEEARTLGLALAALLIAVPLVRVAWLVVRWTGRRDWRFVGAGIGLLAVIGIGVAAVH